MMLDLLTHKSYTCSLPSQKPHNPSSQPYGSARLRHRYQSCVVRTNFCKISRKVSGLPNCSKNLVEIVLGPIPAGGGDPLGSVEFQRRLWENSATLVKQGRTTDTTKNCFRTAGSESCGIKVTVEQCGPILPDTHFS
jgi:hypothetical protein